MIHLSTQSKSFVAILIIVLLAVYGAIELADHFKVDRIPNAQEFQEAKTGTLSTEGWVSYIDKNYPLVFMYPANWKVDQITTEPDYYVVAITPKGQSSEMRVYINDQDFFALNGLPTSPMKIGGQSGTSYGPMLASAKVGKYYYTFDAGLNTSLIPQFQTILSTVEFR